MTAAEQAKNTPKLQSYAERVLSDDPKHTGALITMSNILAASVPTAAGAPKDNHLKNTLDITRRALAAPKIPNLPEASWNAVVVQLHDTATMVLLNQKMYAEAIAEAQTAIKIEKKDGYAYKQKRLAMKPAVADAIAKYQAAVDKLNLPENRSADQLVRDELTATKDGLLAAATAKTNELVEVFAKSVATGWANAAEARKELKIFTGTPEELEKLIADMKVQLGISK
jgi:tetratricopeptide (TPR) repeat protein